ncbi:MAG: hypothetical protein ACI4DS_07785 [Eubacterium sp.]
MASTYGTISMIMFILSVLLFVVSIILFFAFRVDKAVGNVTGITAKKSIKKKNESQAVNYNKLRRFEYEKMVSNTTDGLTNKESIENLNMIDNTATEVLHYFSQSEAETTILNNSEIETELLLNPVETTELFTIVQSITYIHSDNIIVGV